MSLVVPMVRVLQAMHRVVMAPTFVSIVRMLHRVVVRLVCVARGATGGGDAGGPVARVLQAMQRVMGELQRVLQVVQWAVVPLVMSMVRVLQMMDRVMVLLVMPMAREGALGVAVPYLSNTAEEVIKLNTAIKAAALQFEKLPKDLSNVAVRSGHGLRLADVQVICRDSVVATMAQLNHHRATTVRDELRAMLRDMHVQYGVCGQFMVPSASFATHTGNTWVDRVLRAMGTFRVGLLMPSLVYSCVHAHLPQVQWAGRKWMSQSYTFKGRDICILSGPRTDATVQSLTDPANDLLHARLPCSAPGHWAVQLQECHEDHLHLPHAGVGPL